MDDDDLLSLRAEIAVTDAQLTELLTEYRYGNSAENWRELEKLRGHLTVAMAEGNSKKVSAIMELWKDLMKKPRNTPVLREEIRRTIDTRRRLVATEQSRLEAMQQYITNERMLLFINHLSNVFSTHVPFEYLERPLEELAKLLPKPMMEIPPEPEITDVQADTVR
ncbi:MAG: hypothetical protein WDA12_04945 [Bacilli bacterium]